MKHQPRSHGFSYALKRMLAKIFAGEQIANLLPCQPADDNLIRLSQSLQPGRDVWCLPGNVGLFRAGFADNIADHDQAGVDADSDR